jgi:hypothetical protein
MVTLPAHSGHAAAKSTALCLPAISNGLQLANPGGEPWQTENATQERYFAQYGRSGFDLEGLAAYLKSKVTQNAAELTASFAERFKNQARIDG